MQHVLARRWLLWQPRLLCNTYSGKSLATSANRMRAWWCVCGFSVSRTHWTTSSTLTALPAWARMAPSLPCKRLRMLPDAVEQQRACLGAIFRRKKTATTSKTLSSVFKKRPQAQLLFGFQKRVSPHPGDSFELWSLCLGLTYQACKAA